MDFDLNAILKQVQNLQSQMKTVQNELASLTVTAESGGGMVTVTMNGRQEIKQIKLDPICVDPRDIPMLEDLIIAAVNQALKKSRELANDEMRKLTGGLPLPFDLF
ncbi:MAG: YbaB/EbfC family nucleoid-associated protein [Syntrophaceae bacterium]